MRQERISLPRAVRGSGVSRSTALRLAGSALRKLPNGRYVPRASDRLPRVVSLPFVDGRRDVVLRNSKDATLVGEYWNAVHAYLATGDTTRLDRFRGMQITMADGERIPLLTERESLDRLGSAGVLSFETIYSRTV